MRYWASIVVCLYCVLAGASAAHANKPLGPWSVTLYYGPSTTKYFLAVVMSTRMQATGTMLGLAVDRKLAYLGSDISLAAEGQVTQYFFGHVNTTFALGLGLQFEKLFGFKRLSLNVYDGPSYATDPPYTSIGYKGRIWPAARKKWENYVSAELAIALPNTRHWDAVFRLYHRSGAFGLLNASDDDGLALGIGLRCRF